MGQKKAKVVAQGSVDLDTPAEASSSSQKHQDGNAITTSAFSQLAFAEVLEDLSSRFIVNLPAEELSSIERICFQVEQAHWFYEDFLRPLNPSLASYSLRKFSSYLLHTSALTVPLIQQYIPSKSGKKNKEQDLEAAYDEFLKYKTRVPVCGVVMLNQTLDKCVLVKGWKSNAAWGFPKGKINQQESERDCAVREVLEETGFDCDALLPNDSSDYMELTMREQTIRLYIVPRVSEDTHFETQTRKEISRIDWFKLSDLPTWKKNRAPPPGMGGKFYLISPFIGKLKQWIQQRRHHIDDDLSEEEDSPAIAPGTVPQPDEAAEAQSRDLKSLLGLGMPSNDSLNGKGVKMIEEQGDARSRQLLDLLRGEPERGVIGMTNSSAGDTIASEPSQLDEREKGTAALLAALNAGSHKTAMNGNTTNSIGKDDSSAALLSMLRGVPGTATATVPPAAQLPPMAAPQAQRSAQGQKLLDLISPGASMPHPGDNQRDEERKRQREALLSNLMSSNMSISEPPARADNDETLGLRFPPTQPAKSEQQQNLLSLLQGGTPVDPPQPATSPFSTFVQQQVPPAIHSGPLQERSYDMGNASQPADSERRQHAQGFPTTGQPYPPPHQYASPPFFNQHPYAPPPPPAPPHYYVSPSHIHQPPMGLPPHNPGAYAHPPPGATPHHPYVHYLPPPPPPSTLHYPHQDTSPGIRQQQASNVLSQLLPTR